MYLHLGSRATVVFRSYPDCFLPPSRKPITSLSSIYRTSIIEGDAGMQLTTSERYVSLCHLEVLACGKTP